MVAGPPCLRGPCALVALVMVETGVARVCIGSSHIDKTIFCFWQRQCHNDVVTDVVPDPFRAVTTSLYLLTTLVVPTDKTILCFWQRQCQTSARIVPKNARPIECVLYRTCSVLAKAVPDFSSTFACSVTVQLT